MRKSTLKWAHALIVSLLAAAAWAVSVGMSYAPAEADRGGGCTDTSPQKSLTREEMAQLLRESTKPVEFVPAESVEQTPGDNCAKVSSCGARIGCFKVFGGGSQRIYDNKILACVRDDHKNCHPCQCYVKTYPNLNCSGKPDEEGWVERRGCKKQVTK